MNVSSVSGKKTIGLFVFFFTVIFPGLLFAETVPDYTPGTINTFVTGTPILASAMNDNFAEVSAASLQVDYITDLVNGNLDSTNIEDGTIEGADILDSSLTSNDLANDASSLNKVARGLMTSASSRIYATRMQIGTNSDARQCALGQHGWLDISSSSAGYGLIASNAYLSHLSNEFIYSNDHSTLGACGMSFNYPSGHLSLFTGIGESVADATFTPTPRLTIDPEGNVGIGTVNPAVPLQIVGGTNASLWDGSGTLLIGYESGTNMVLDANEINARDDGEGVTLYLNYDAPAPVYIGSTLHGSSDRRVKTDIETITGALDKTLALRGVRFRYIDDYCDDTSPKIGLIAQEVQPIVPEVVTGTENLLGVSYKDMVGLLVEAIKELNAKYEELELKHKQLEAAVLLDSSMR